MYLHTSNKHHKRLNAWDGPYLSMGHKHWARGCILQPFIDIFVDWLPIAFNVPLEHFFHVESTPTVDDRFNTLCTEAYHGHKKNH